MAGSHELDTSASHSTELEARAALEETPQRRIELGTIRDGMTRVTAGQLLVPETSLKLGTLHLRRVLDQYEGRVELALAGYNAGEHRVDRWMTRFSISDPADPDQVVDRPQLAVRDGDAVTDAGREHRLTLFDGSQDLLAIVVGVLGRDDAHELAEQRLLGARLERDTNAVGRQELGQQHGKHAVSGVFAQRMNALT